MKALSVRQPWAWAILHAGKPIENRSRKDGKMPAICRHRGPLLIHASAGCSCVYHYDAAVELHRAGLADATTVARARGFVIGPPTPGARPVPMLWNLPRGGIVGRAVAVGHVDPSGDYHIERLRSPKPIPDPDMRWHIPGHWGLILTDREPLPFVPWKGALGLFNVDDQVFARALEQARAA